MAKDKEEQAASQLDIENQINKVLKQRSAVLQSQAKYLSQQTQLAMELCSALECKNLDGMKERLEEIQKGLSDAADQAKSLEGGAQSAGSALQNMASGATKQGSTMSKVFSPMTGMFVGLGIGAKSAFESIKNSIGAVFEAAKVTTGVIWKIGQTILSMPIDFLNGLTEASKQNAEAMQGFRQAVEDVRRQFGDLSKAEGKAVMDGFANMPSQLAAAGVSAGSVFGYGPEGMAAMLKEVNEQVTDLGDSMNVFKDEVAKNAGEFAIYRRGLGLTGEAFKAMGTMAQTTGKTLEETLGEVANQALQMGNKFGVSSKEVAKSMAEMAGDVANFGGMGTKELAAMAVYTKKLGINAKELNGVISKWDNFEDAAAGASKLSQAFGMNIDAMKMMNEQNPAKRMEMLRDSFKSTGRSVEDLSRQELKLLAAQMGLSEEAAKKALSSDVDYDEIAEASEEAEDSAMSQAKAMKELAKSIDKLTNNPKLGSFMEALSSGFSSGIMQGEGMQKLMGNIQQSMQIAYDFAKQLGKAFIDMFPGIKQMIGALTDIFNLKKFRTLSNDLLKTFKDLFTSLKSDPRGGVKRFIDNISADFRNFFSKSSGARVAFLDGLKEFGKTLLVAFLSLVPEAMKGLAGLIKDLAAAISGPGGVGDGISAALGVAWKSIKDTWPELKAAFFALWDAVKPAISGLWKEIAPWLLTFVFGKAILAVVSNIGIGAMLGGALKMLVGGVGNVFKGALQKLGGVFGDLLGAGNPKNTESLAKQIGDIGEAIGTGIQKFLDALRKIEKKDIINAAAILVILSGAFATSLVLFAIGLSVAIAAGGLALNDPAKVVGFMISVYLAVKAAATVVEVASKLKPADIEKAVPGMLAMLVLIPILGSLGALLAVMINMSPDIELGKMLKFLFALGTVLAMSVVVLTAGLVIGAILSLGGSVPLILGGLIAMVALVPLMGYVGVELVKMINGVPDVPITKVLGFLLTLGSFLTAAAVLIPTALAVGAVAVFGAPLVAVGLVAMLKIVDALAEKIKSVIETIATIPEWYIDTIQKAMPMIKDIMDIMFKGIGTVVEISRLIDTLKGGEETIQKSMNFVNNIMETLSTTLVSTLGYLNTVVTGDPDIISKKVSAIAGLVSALVPIADIAKAGLELSKINKEEAAAAMKRAGDLVTTISTDMGTFITTLVDQTKRFTLDDLKKAEAVGKLLQGVGAMMSSIKLPPELLNTVTGKNKTDGTFTDTESTTLIEKSSDKIAAFGNAVVTMLGAMGPAIQQIVTAVAGIKIEGKLSNFKIKVEAIAKLLESFGGLGQIISVLGSEAGWQKAGAAEATGKNSGMSRLLELFNPSEGGKSKIQQLIDGVGGITIPKGFVGIANGLKPLPDALNVINSAISASAAAPLEQSKTTIAVVQEIIKNYEEIEKLLSNTKAIDITAKLNKFGEDMAISTKKITIENKPINIQVNLSITMDANEIAYNLSDVARPAGKDTLTLSRRGNKSTISQ